MRKAGSLTNILIHISRSKSNELQIISKCKCIKHHKWIQQCIKNIVAVKDNCYSQAKPMSCHVMTGLRFNRHHFLQLFGSITKVPLLLLTVLACKEPFESIHANNIDSFYIQIYVCMYIHVYEKAYFVKWVGSSVL